MRETESGLVIPNPISFNKQGILMEYIEFGKSSERQFGVCLAKMHLHNRNSTNQGNIFARTKLTSCKSEYLYYFKKTSSFGVWIQNANFLR